VKTFSIRVQQKFSGAESDSVAAWLRQTLESGSPLAADPGAGEVTLRLSLDENQVQQLCQRESEKPAVALRRLIATRAPSLPAQTEFAAEKPEEKSALDAELLPPKSELPRRMQLVGEDVLPLVKLLAVGERALLRWQLKIPKEAHLPEDDASDRALAEASAMVLNSRAPAVFTRNGDVVKFSLVFIRHAWSSYEIAEKYAREHAKEQAGRVTAAAASVPASSPVSGASAEIAAPVMTESRSDTFVEDAESQRRRLELLRRSAEEEMGVFGSGEPI
jgi:hypothetical protein